MRLGIFSDLHVHNYSAFGKPVGGGVNSRAVNTLNILTQIHTKANDLELDLLCFCGDLFEAKGILPVPLIVATKTALDTLIEDISLIVVPGNHDIAVREDNSCTALDVFNDKENYFILDGEILIADKDIWILGIGADTELSDIKEEQFKYIPENSKGILLMHKTFINTIIAPTGHKADTGISLREVELFMKKHNIMKCFCGDIHIRQQLRENIWYVGNPLQIGFGDNQEKGMLVFDTTTNDLVFVELEAPKFFKLDYENNLVLDDYNYFSINTKNKEEFEKAQSLKKDNVIIEAPPKEFGKDRSVIKLEMNTEDVLLEYLKMKKVKNKSRLYALGKELLAEAKKDS